MDPITSYTARAHARFASFHVLPSRAARARSYEPLFFYPEESWADECGEGGCYAELTVPSNSTKVNTEWCSCTVAL